MNTLSTKDVLRRDIKKAEVTLSSKHQEKQNEQKFLILIIVYITSLPPKKTVHELKFVDFTYRYFIYLGFLVLKEEKEEKKLSIIYDIYRNAGGFFGFVFS